MNITLTIRIVLNPLSHSTLNIYNTLLIGRLVLTWFPSPPRQIVYPLATLCDPYLNLFRGIIPPVGGTIDLSPILAFTVLNVFTNTAAALPAEVDAKGNLIRSPTASERVGSVAKKAWARRMAAHISFTVVLPLLPVTPTSGTSKPARHAAASAPSASRVSSTTIWATGIWVTGASTR